MGNLYKATGQDGRFSFPDIEFGDYHLGASVNCEGAAQEVSLVGDLDVTLEFGTYVDPNGYSCSLEDSTWIPGDALLPAPQEDEEGNEFHTLPFPFPYAGYTHTRAEISPGNVWLHPADTDHDNGADIEFYPDGTCVSPQGGVYTKVLGTAPLRQFVVETRNCSPSSDPSRIINSEIVLREDGQMTFTVKDPSAPWVITSTQVYAYKHDGSGLSYYEAAVGENADGFRTGKSLVIHPPAGS